jgi:esterase
MKLFYRKFGSGPPLFILHGLFGSSDNWVSIARNISSSFSVYIPDLRNHGQSPHSSEHNYNLMSHDLFELVEDLKIDKFILAGHSMGGKIAVDFALNWPDRINSLIVIDISPFIPLDYSDKIYLQNLEILEAILSINLSEYNSRSEVESLLAKKIDSEKIRGLIQKNLQRNNEGFYVWKLNAEAIKENLNFMMEGVKLPGPVFIPVTGFPVTFVKGEESEYLQLSELKELQKIFPTTQIISVKNAGHWINAEKPEIIESILLNQLYY